MKPWRTMIPSRQLEQFVAEFRENKRVRFGLIALLILILVTFWPTSRTSPSSSFIAGDPPLRIKIQSLPDVAGLDQAAILLPVPKLLRNIFSFSAPVPEPVVVKAKVVIPPPPTPEEVAQRELELDRQTELNGAPSEFRFLGYIKASKPGMFGGFMNGEEPYTLQVGTILKGKWKLVSINENEAKFQNLKYSDLIYTASISGAGF